jgi:polyribonucleotide nucleotidyltransferase
MDTKIKGLNIAIIKKTLSQAKEARNKILDIMLSVIPEPNKSLSVHAPTIETTSVPVDSIGKIVGPGGKMIRQLQQDYGVTLSISEDGVVSITGQDKDALENVKKVIKGIAYDPVAGEIYKGKVLRIMDYGAFVEIFPGKEGLVHISQISKEHVKNIDAILKIGQMIDVKLIEVDFQGRLNFTMLLDEEIKKRNVSTKNFNDKKDRDGRFDNNGRFDKKRRNY